MRHTERTDDYEVVEYQLRSVTSPAKLLYSSGFSSNRSIPVGERVRSSKAPELFPLGSFFQLFATVLQRYSGFMPARSPGRH